MRTAANVMSITEAGEELGLTRQTVSEVSRVLGIEFKPMRLAGRPKGLNPDDLRRIREALGIPERQEQSVA